VGGRATLIGPVIGAFVVNLAKSFFTVAFPEYWLFFLGALFVGVTLWLPDGVVGLWRKLREKRAQPELKAKLPHERMATCRASCCCTKSRSASTASAR
jgi:hypothetical protein